MIKKATLLTAFSVTAFSAWAQDTSPDTLVVTANRFQQPVNSVLAPTDVVTREDIQRWQSKDLNDVMRRLPGVDISQSGGMGKSSSLYVRGTESRHVLVLIDGVPMARAGISNAIDIGQLPVSLVQRIEYIRGPRSAVYGSGAIGGVVNIITMSNDEKSQINAGMGSDGYQTYDGIMNKRFGDTIVTAAGAYETTRGFNIQPDSPYNGDSDRDGYRNKLFWGGVQHKFNDNVSGFFRGYGYTANSDYDQGSYGYVGGNDEAQNYTQSWDAGLQYSSGIYSSQLIANYQHIKDYNYSNDLGRYAGDASLDNMEQRYIQWGNSVEVGHGAVSGGADWKQEKLTSSSTTKADTYKRDTTGLYLTGQQQIDSVTLEASGREDHDEQFGWHGTWQTATGWEFVDGYRATLSYGTGFLAPSLGQQYGATRFASSYGPGIAANPNLKPEESRQWEAGIDGLTGPLDWRLSAYHYKVQNLIDYKDNQYVNLKSATIKGLEWTGNITTGPVDHHLTLQYVDPRDDETNKVLYRRAKQQVKYELTGQIFELGWNVMYQYLGERYDKDYDNNRDVKMGGLSLWDIGVSYPATSHLTVRGKIANLFDKDYETVYGYQTAGREYTLSGSYTF
ncbi:TonB-dependent vitamin B12 receptor BtuB [Salmonella enterica subsp. enterica serovar Ohio]|uniref:Vitamin B12 transporter BtuB n=1 Tax=Salmonella enterica subsp. enterica serovar Ohio TaxID=117541 RepID=A0A5W4EYX4_SALET|nr:TonB-dependent vitamin B12 receptor BtuB [Salmonella enterica subsp. enterica serovar Ohio]EBV5504184.1 vitamin B12/cobalamin outer membrane transporter [Salmonella enterica subsp. enterica serovar Ohio]EBW8257546.1 TonB-dependent vitamin B12 receptor BtuB [Salmonella enterica subsp. enterica serovar Ohio]EDI1176380.1 vitamin B12/cobalamin outer membrane transporter [Salmonella enterica subsp. enterica serovar Ohio]EDV6830195.1 TonB-dependent vitamin B12 receptor BtuB [Salmonella enterica su